MSSFAKSIISSSRVVGLSTNPLNFIQIRTATKRVSSSRTNNKDSPGKRLGPKEGDGSFVKPGNIIMRQRGTKIHPGENARIGKDHTIYAVEPGFVRFYRDPFHPLRKYVGVALRRDLTLPKHHFDSRIRRFGYIELKDPEAANREENFRSRKEILHQPELERKLKEKEEFRKTTLSSFSQGIEEQSKLVLSAEELELASSRLLALFELSQTGQTWEAAQTQETFNQILSLKLQARRGEITQEEFVMCKQNYIELASKIDNELAVSCDGQICKYLNPEELLAKKEELKANMELLMKEKGTAKEYRTEVTSLINTPGVFNKEEQKELEIVFLPSELPYAVPGSVIPNVRPKDATKELHVQQIYDESRKRYSFIGRPRTVFE
ncbi:54S ribosomal protein L2 mitochondrial [Spathaspora sp. JA1]|nr:54S ribosomal protein L2 mitochondrial [Spathaspora sp. JA1]